MSLISLSYVFTILIYCWLYSCLQVYIFPFLLYCSVACVFQVSLPIKFNLIYLVLNVSVYKLWKKTSGWSQWIHQCIKNVKLITLKKRTAPKLLRVYVVTFRTPFFTELLCNFFNFFGNCLNLSAVWIMSYACKNFNNQTDIDIL